MDPALQSKISTDYPDWLAQPFVQYMQLHISFEKQPRQAQLVWQRLVQRQTDWVRLWLRYLLILQASGFWLSRFRLEDWKTFPSACQSGASIKLLSECLNQVCSFEQKGPLPFQNMHYWLVQHQDQWRELLKALETPPTVYSLQDLKYPADVLFELLNKASFMFDYEIYGIISTQAEDCIGIRYKGQAVKGFLSGSIPVQPGGLYIEEPRIGTRFQLPFLYLCSKCVESERYRPLVWKARSSDGGLLFAKCQHGTLNVSEKILLNTDRESSAFVQFKPQDHKAQISQNSIKTNSLGMEFVRIDPGQFQMGSPTAEMGRQLDEMQHQVTLTQPYYLMITPVTQAQWTKIMGKNPSYFQDSECPVENISYFQIEKFIARLQSKDGYAYRLPSEAEWEYACRAGHSGPYGFDIEQDELADYAWYEANSYQDYEIKRMHPVACLKPNAWGLYDMHGNVWEWVSDWYDHHPIRAQTDPEGPSDSDCKVIKGGRWNSSALNCRAASRSQLEPAQSQPGSLGFRLILMD